MVWSLLKVLVFVILVSALALGAGFLLQSGGGIRIALVGWEFTLGPVQAMVGLAILMGAAWLFVRLVGFVVAVIRFVTGDETAISRYFDRNRERKGLDALAQGYLALASGDGRLALARAIKAERYLDAPHLTDLLVAQSAEAAGDSRRATETWKKMLGSDQTRFVAIRGLLRQKLAAGDGETALKLAEKAFEMQPRNSEIHDTLLQLQAQRRDWQGARATLGAKLKAGTLPRAVFRRRDAVLALQQARGVMDDESPIAAREAAIEANRLSPDLIPAAAMAARALIDKGNGKSAARILKKAYDAQPHPDLAAAYAEIAPDETPGDRVKRMAQLVSGQPDHPESRMLLAEAQIAAEDFVAARRALGDLVETAPSQRALAIMAAIERGSGADDAVVRGWMARALTAPRGHQWCCDACQAVQPAWEPICDNCGGFDTLTWREPVEGARTPGAELLPVIVGRPDRAAPDRASPDAEPDAKDDIVTILRNAT